MSGGVVKLPSPQVAAFYRGERWFKEGRDAPPRPPADDSCTSIPAIEYLGWMTARGLKLMREWNARERAMRLLEVPYREPQLPADNRGHDVGGE